MIVLRYHKDFRAAQNYGFCFSCGQMFSDGDVKDLDHIPPKTAFHVKDRTPPLKIAAHEKCNNAYSVVDKQMGQLIALKRGEWLAKARRDESLLIRRYPHLDMAAIENVHIEAAVWRWVKGFHAALYKQPLISSKKALQTPFPRGELQNDKIYMHHLLPQHTLTVEAIKRNRAYNNVDRISSNNNKLTYECVWAQFDNSENWFCMFALDIYGWKDLGSSTKDIPARGCVGLYVPDDNAVPIEASKDHIGKILIPNFDPLDAFSP